MVRLKLLRHIAVCGVSLPSFAASPAVAKATVYMPSRVAARVLGGRVASDVDETMDSQPAADDQTAT
jgi:hypothetical protein